MMLVDPPDRQKNLNESYHSHLQLAFSQMLSIDANGLSWFVSHNLHLFEHTYYLH